MKDSKALSLKERLLIKLVDSTKPLYCKLFKKEKKTWKVEMGDLKKLPEATLGKALYNFFESEDLSLMPSLEDHDVLHVLMKYKTTVKDEIKMQFFLLGNGKRSLYALGTALLGILLAPKFIKSFIAEFKRGTKCLNISKWDFEYLLNEEVEVLRRLICKEPVKGKLIF